MDADALRSSGMLQMLTSPDGRAKLQGLAQQVRTTVVHAQLINKICVEKRRKCVSLEHTLFKHVLVYYSI